MMIIMSVHHQHRSSSSSSSLSFFIYVSIRPDLRCRRCADMIIMMTAGDAEDAS